MLKFKIIKSMMTVALCFMFSTQTVAYYVSLQIDNPNYYLSYADGYIDPLDDEDASVKPIIRSGSTLLPMRATLNALNFDGPDYIDVEWDNIEKKVSVLYKSAAEEGFSQIVAEFWISKTTAVYYDEDGRNGKNVTIPNAPIIINGRTYLPLRAVIDAFEYLEIEWVDSKKGIVIYQTVDRPEAILFPDGSSVNFVSSVQN